MTLHDPQLDVKAFHHVMNLGKPESPVMLSSEVLGLRMRLMREELKEFHDAMVIGDIIEAIDGLCDLLYTTYGTAVEMGVDLELFWDEVHASNMRKAGGPIRPDGKILKPEGWKPPNLLRIFHMIYGDHTLTEQAASTPVTYKRTESE